jgi:hypothetical protein
MFQLFWIDWSPNLLTSSLKKLRQETRINAEEDILGNESPRNENPGLAVDKNVEKLPNTISHSYETELHTLRSFIFFCQAF